MKMSRTSLDRDALPDALLDTAKTHMRVEFARDDDYIKLCLKRAIDFFERTTGMMVNPATYDWAPGPGATIDGQYVYEFPFQPEPSFVVKDENSADISSQFSIRGPGSPDEFGVRAFVGSVAYATTNSTVVTVGYEDQDALPPGILNFVLQAASWFYEYREAGPMPGADGVPYLNQLLTAYWVPRV